MNFLVFLITNYTFCSCAELPPLSYNDVLTADVIFIGEVIGKRSAIFGEDWKISFKVKEGLKGVSLGKTVHIYTPKYGSMCGLDISKRELWYVFPRKNRWKFIDSICSRSGKISESSYKSQRIRTEIEFIKTNFPQNSK